MQACEQPVILGELDDVTVNASVVDYGRLQTFPVAAWIYETLQDSSRGGTHGTLWVLQGEPAA